MPRQPKTRIVSIKVAEDLAKLLDAVPNKSEFIRTAIIARCGVACPLCTGTGVVFQGVGTHFTEVFEANRDVSCGVCGAAEPIPLDPATAPAADRPRWEQFFRGGGYYCARCHADAPGCGDCGWHLPPNALAKHARSAHGD